MDKNEMRWETLDDIIEHWSKDDVAMELLRENGIAEVESIEDIERYENGDDREGLIYHVKEKDADIIQKILVDVKLGQSTTDQVYEAVYGVGKECDKRIIVFTEDFNENDKNNPAADMHVVDNCISVLNEYSLNMQLFYLDEDTFNLVPYNHCLLTTEACWENEMSNIPSEEQFRFEEFWMVYLDSLCEGFYTPWEAFSGNFRTPSDWGYCIFVDPIADLPVYWNDSGITYIIKQTHDDHDYLKEIWDTKKEEIQKRYDEKNVDFEYLPGRLPKIKIKYSNRPVNWLFSATPKEKMEFAKTLYKDMWDLRWVMENAYEEDREKVAV